MNWWNCNWYRFDTIKCVHYRTKVLDVIMTIHGLGFRVHLSEIYIVAHFLGVIGMHSFW
jgi:hypothetical protein